MTTSLKIALPLAAFLASSAVSLAVLRIRAIRRRAAERREMKASCSRTRECERGSR